MTHGDTVSSMELKGYACACAHGGAGFGQLLAMATQLPLLSALPPSIQHGAGGFRGTSAMEGFACALTMVK